MVLPKLYNIAHPELLLLLTLNIQHTHEKIKLREIWSFSRETWLIKGKARTEDSMLIL